MLGGEAREGGLTLAEYAAVRAATAEPFPLEDVLGVEGIDSGAWASADLAWTERLASEPPLLTEYERALAAAEDKLGRKVTPISSDLEAWLAFLLECDGADAESTLAKYKLGVNDLARLSRTWSKRFKLEPALQKRAAEIRKRGPAKLPGIVVGQSVLRAFGGGAGSFAPKLEVKEASAIGELPMELDRYARLAAELIAAPRDKAAILARFNLTASSHANVDARFRDQLHSDAVMASDFARLRDHHRARIAARAGAVEAPISERAAELASPSFAPPHPSKAAWSIDEPGTAIADVAAIIAPALPFRDGAPRVLEDLAPASRPIKAGAGSDGATVVAMPSPFAAREIDDETTTVRDSPLATLDLEDPPTLHEPETPLVEVASVQDGTSAPVPSPFADKPLPFDPPPKATPLVMKRAEPPPVRLDSGTVTGVLSPFLTAKAPPFAQKTPSVAPLPPPKSPPKRTKTPRVGELHAPRAMPPPSQRAPVSTSEPLSSPAPLNAPVSTRTPPAESPPMSLEQHAALCVEIAIYPGRDAEVLARNGVDANLKARADRFWKDLAAQDPSIRAAWTRAFDSYHAMFLRGGR